MQDLLFELVSSLRAERSPAVPVRVCVQACRRVQSANPCPVPSPFHLFLWIIRFNFSTSYSLFLTLSRDRLIIKILAGGNIS